MSGPLLDRIDLVVPVPAAAQAMYGQVQDANESSAAIRSRVEGARQRQRMRGESGARLNRDLTGQALIAACGLERSAAALLEAAAERFCLSPRGCERVLRVSRSIADLRASPVVASSDVAEALQYRFAESSPLHTRA